MGEVTHDSKGQLKVLGGDLPVPAFTTKFDALLAWARKYSLFQYPFATACCGMEFFAVAGPRYDVARFGAEAPRFIDRRGQQEGDDWLISSDPAPNTAGCLRLELYMEVRARPRPPDRICAQSTR